MSETFYYGKGKVYLAHRDTNGRPGAWRWVGDVSSLSVSISAEYKTSKMSLNGKLFVGKKNIIGYTGSLAATWLDFSNENLSILLNSVVTTIYPEAIEHYELPAGIVSGDRVSLPHQRVWGVSIPNLTEAVDYIVDPLWGVLEFLVTPNKQPLTVDYEHPGRESIPLIGHVDNEFSFRFEGINLAENNSYTLLELYRLAYEPVASWQLISDGNTLTEVNTTAEIMIDPNKMHDPILGIFGQVSIFGTLSGITHDGSILHDGKYTYRG